MNYKLQYRKEKDEEGTVIYELIVDGTKWREGNYIEQREFIENEINDSDTYQEARPNGEVYHECNGVEFMKSMQEHIEFVKKIKTW